MAMDSLMVIIIIMYNSGHIYLVIAQLLKSSSLYLGVDLIDLILCEL